MTAGSAVYCVDSLGVFDINDQLSDLGWRVRGEFGKRRIFPQGGEDVVFGDAGATTAIDRPIWFYRHDMRCEKASGLVAVRQRDKKDERSRSERWRMQSRARQADGGWGGTDGGWMA